MPKGTDESLKNTIDIPLDFSLMSLVEIIGMLSSQQKITDLTQLREGCQMRSQRFSVSHTSKY